MNKVYRAKAAFEIDLKNIKQKMFDSILNTDKSKPSESNKQRKMEKLNE